MYYLFLWTYRESDSGLCNANVEDVAHTYCGPKETRTPHLSNANAALYQMSYRPVLWQVWAGRDSNSQPPPLVRRNCGPKGI